MWRIFQKTYLCTLWENQGQKLGLSKPLHMEVKPIYMEVNQNFELVYLINYTQKFCEMFTFVLTRQDGLIVV